MERHCLRIPFVIGPSAVIGNSCSDRPIWEVPCEDIDLPADTDGSATLADQTCVTLTLSEPTEIVVV